MSKKFRENIHGLVYFIGAIEFVFGIAFLIISLVDWVSRGCSYTISFTDIQAGVVLLSIGIFIFSWGRIVENSNSIAESQQKISSHFDKE